MLIKGVAIKDINGVVISLDRPARHHHVISKMANLEYDTPIKGVQGFITDIGTFVDRKEALIIATNAGQILPGKGTFNQLYSEDLW